MFGELIGLRLVNKYAQDIPVLLLDGMPHLRFGVENQAFVGQRHDLAKAKAWI